MTTPIFDGAFTTDPARAKWGLWTFVWRPLRGRWCLVLDRKNAMPWTAQELAVDPALRAVSRPATTVCGSVALAMDAAAKMLPPFMDVLDDSPFFVRIGEWPNWSMEAQR